MMLVMSLAKKSGRRKRKKTVSARLPHIPHVLLLIDTAGSFGRGIVEGIGRYALENGPWSIQFEYRALDSMPPAWLKDWKGDGIISRTVNVKQIKMLWETRLPLVELHGYPEIGLPKVQSDISIGARMVVNHFLNCELRHFAFFSYGDAWWVKLQLAVYRKVLEEHHHTCHCYQPPPSDGSLPVWHESQQPALLKWISSLPRPIGIYAPGDLHAVRLLNACRELNIAVPEEIAILGRGNDAVICETVHPTLSSLDLNSRLFGYEAAGLLDRIMAGESSKDTIWIPPSHVAIRRSTDIVAIEDADIARAVQFIRQFACMGIDVPRVAEEVQLSRTVLENQFRRYLGRSPKAEIMRVRMEHAKMLLTRTDKTCENVAHKSGFSSLEYFIKAFRREVGMTPQTYRRMQKSTHPADDFSDR
jgi:LacI family transcriptional regulator